MVRRTDLEGADNPGFSETPVNLDAKAFELFGHDAGGAIFLKGNFGMFVQIPPRGRQLIAVAVYSFGHLCHSVHPRSRPLMM